MKSQNKKSNENSKKKNTAGAEKLNISNRRIIISAAGAFLLAAVIIASLFFYGKSFLTAKPKLLTAEEQQTFSASKAKNWPEETEKILSPLPYRTKPVELKIDAKSAVVIDSSNGCIIYEKNADEIIPPASMTKLAVMFVVEQEIAKGRISYSDMVPLPPECWAVNQPQGSSLMFLAKDQRVTLDELLTGLAVCSGNDAAYAVASYVAGSTEAFVERMNEEMQKLKLYNTHFVEPSGYSELNTTTAKEFAAFSYIYLKKYPESIAKYHSVKSFSYPKAKNLPPYLTPEEIEAGSGNIFIPYKSITQKNTNKLLDILEGTDGLKTGYIDESGYNLSLTVKRGKTRFISVTMGGSGANSIEGNKNRIQDGTTLMEFAFTVFSTKDIPEWTPYTAAVTGGKANCAYLVPLHQKSVTVPHIAGFTEEAPLTRKIIAPERISAPLAAGVQYGKVQYFLGETLLEEVPLIADRNIAKANFLKRMADNAACSLAGIKASLTER